METHLEERRREEEAKRRRIEALTLRENIMSVSISTSKIYHRRELKEKDPSLKKKMTNDSSSP